MEAFFDVLQMLLCLSGIWLFSFGRWRSESISIGEGRVFAPTGALSFLREGQHVITCNGQILAGVVMVVVLTDAIFMGLSLR